MKEHVDLGLVGTVTFFMALFGFIAGALVSSVMMKASIDDQCRDAKAQLRAFERVSK